MGTGTAIAFGMFIGWMARGLASGLVDPAVQRRIDTDSKAREEYRAMVAKMRRRVGED